MGDTFFPDMTKKADAVAKAQELEALSEKKEADSLARMQRGFVGFESSTAIKSKSVPRKTARAKATKSKTAKDNRAKSTKSKTASKNKPKSKPKAKAKAKAKAKKTRKVVAAPRKGT